MESIYTTDEIRRLERPERHDNKRIEILKKLLTPKKYSELEEYLKDSGAYLFKFVRQHDVGGKKQDQEYWFTPYVAQSCGYSGDDFSGNIWIKITDKHYLRFYFNC